ncbi:MAG: hypothetical protein V2A75_05240 [Pseudomonadota bacterium]
MQQIIFFFILLLFSGCSTLSYNVNQGKLDKNQKIVVDVFSNYTETPMAGYRAASIMDAALLQRGFKSNPMYSMVSDESSNVETPLTERIQKAKNSGASLLATGEVIEWRYKTGIDGEPAVSLVIRVYDTQTAQVIFSSTGSKNGLGYSSIGLVANDVINGMLP